MTKIGHVVMKEVEGFSVEEISESLGMNVNTVKVPLFRSRAKLVEVYRRRLKCGAQTSENGSALMTAPVSGGKWAMWNRKATEDVCDQLLRPCGWKTRLRGCRRRTV